MYLNQPSVRLNEIHTQWLAEIAPIVSLPKCDGDPNLRFHDSAGNGICHVRNITDKFNRRRLVGVELDSCSSGPNLQCQSIASVHLRQVTFDT